MRKRTRPTPDELAIPDDIAEAREVRAETTAAMADLHAKAPMLERLANVMINRQGKNHYIELLYHHAPKGAS